MIEHMGSYFAAAHHEVTAPLFATGVLRQQQAAVQRALDQGAILPKALLNIKIGDPALPSGSPVWAYANAGRWIAKCPDDAGCEFVDFENAVFMCCSCWNGKNGYQWRPVVLPAEPLISTGDLFDSAASSMAIGVVGPPTRAEIEAALLARPDVATQNWTPDQTVADLLEENAAHGLVV